MHCLTERPDIIEQINYYGQNSAYTVRLRNHGRASSHFHLIVAVRVRGAFVSVPALVAAIEAFLAAWNNDPKPFIWTAKVEDIMAKRERARAKLDLINPGCTKPRGR